MRTQKENLKASGLTGNRIVTAQRAHKHTQNIFNFS